jgi:hypothetical protein
MNVRFSHDDQFLFSAGGADKAIMQWRVLRGGAAAADELNEI